MNLHNRWRVTSVCDRGEESCQGERFKLLQQDVTYHVSCMVSQEKHEPMLSGVMFFFFKVHSYEILGTFQKILKHKTAIDFFLFFFSSRGNVIFLVVIVLFSCPLTLQKHSPLNFSN